jgi:hypothetical protein
VPIACPVPVTRSGTNGGAVGDEASPAVTALPLGISKAGPGALAGAAGAGTPD